jgi:hypothetical protein
MTPDGGGTAGVNLRWTLGWSRGRPALYAKNGSGPAVFQVISAAQLTLHSNLKNWSAILSDQGQ